MSKNMKNSFYKLYPTATGCKSVSFHFLMKNEKSKKTLIFLFIHKKSNGKTSGRKTLQIKAERNLFGELLMLARRKHVVNLKKTNIVLS